MTDGITIRLPTETLKSILGDNPQVLLDIEHRACEKIAEEVRRKVKSSLDEIIGKGVDQAMHTAMKRAAGDMRDKFRFPDEAREIVRDLVCKEIKKAEDCACLRLNRVVDEAVGREMTKMKNQITAHANEAMQKEFDTLAERTRLMAREEFFKVLAEAKGIT
jgi:hypothetical protein